MDHRWSERSPLQISVVMDYAPLGLIAGRTRDISSEGMFVETGRILLYRNDSVAISFANPHGEDRCVMTVEACVRHVTENGVGLMFRGFKLEAEADPNIAKIAAAYH